MQSFGKKIRFLRENREWTQQELAEQLHVSPSTVQKWEVEKNTPDVMTMKQLAQLFLLDISDLVNDEVEVASFSCESQERTAEGVAHQDTIHAIYDASLCGGAMLHRFHNCVGVPYSGIYIGESEVWSIIREKEAQMIKDWNERYCS